MSAFYLVYNNLYPPQTFLSGKRPEQDHITILVSFPFGEGLRIACQPLAGGFISFSFGKD
ncbi:hypothetical protein [Marivirga sp.]|uniref:hypothetical protein n=1 Tax=Marivirga sp. TaxID=2018662 RepID=UPI0025D9D3C0|nr:hypothetical protein [Marivirga sp.]